MAIGCRPQIHLDFSPWNDDWTVEPERDSAAGRIPLISWEPEGIGLQEDR